MRSPRWISLVGALVAVVLAAVVATRLPVALARGDRAGEIRAMEQRLAQVRADTTELQEQAVMLQDKLAARKKENAKARQRIDGQEARIAELELRIAELGG